MNSLGVLKRQQREQEQLGVGGMMFDLGMPLGSHGLEETAFGQQGPIIFTHPFLYSEDMFSAWLLSTVLMSTPSCLLSKACSHAAI